MEKYQESLATKVSKNKKLNIPNADWNAVKI
jgi:hypothetical protein